MMKTYEIGIYALRNADCYNQAIRSIVILSGARRFAGKSSAQSKDLLSL